MSALRATRFILKPVSRPDKVLEALKTAAENAKVLNEYAKEQYDRSEERLAQTNTPRPAWAMYSATEAYSFSLARYLRATLELNRYLLDCAFPLEQKGLVAAA